MAFAHPTINHPASFDYRRRRFVTLLCQALVVLMGFGSNVLIAPIAGLIQISLCKQYFHTHQSPGVAHGAFSAIESIDESMCQIKDIQQEMALIVGAIGLLSALAELVVTIPLGCLASVNGKRQIMIMNVIGTTLYYSWTLLVCCFSDVFPARAVTACAFFSLIGGGPHVFSAMLYGTVADINSEQTRTKAFYRIQTVVQVTQLASPVVGSLLMGLNPWAPFAIGIPVLVVVLCLAVFALPDTGTSTSMTALSSSSSSVLGFTYEDAAVLCPCSCSGKSSDETDSDNLEARGYMDARRGDLSGITETQPLLGVSCPHQPHRHHHHHPHHHHHHYEGSSPAHGNGLRIHTGEHVRCPPRSGTEESRKLFTKLLRAELARVAGLFCSSPAAPTSGVQRRGANDPRISRVVVAFFVTSLGRQFLGVLLQYVTVRYHWTFAQAGYLFSLKSLITILLFVVMLPAVTNYLTTKRGMLPMRVDLWVARSSIMFLGTGSLFIAFSPTIGFFIPSLLLLCLGFGFGVAMQSLVTSLLADKSLIPRIYSLISLFESTGTLVGHSLLSVAFAGGIRIGGLGVGLPFFFCSAFYYLAAIPVWTVNLSPSPSTVPEPDPPVQIGNPGRDAAGGGGGNGPGEEREDEESHVVHVYRKTAFAPRSLDAITPRPPPPETDTTGGLASTTPTIATIASSSASPPPPRPMV